MPKNTRKQKAASRRTPIEGESSGAHLSRRKSSTAEEPQPLGDESPENPTQNTPQAATPRVTSTAAVPSMTLPTVEELSQELANIKQKEQMLEQLAEGYQQVFGDYLEAYPPYVREHIERRRANSKRQRSVNKSLEDKSSNA